MHSATVNVHETHNFEPRSFTRGWPARASSNHSTVGMYCCMRRQATAGEQAALLRRAKQWSRPVKVSVLVALYKHHMMPRHAPITHMEPQLTHPAHLGVLVLHSANPCMAAALAYQPPTRSSSVSQSTMVPHTSSHAACESLSPHSSQSVPVCHCPEIHTVTAKQRCVSDNS